MSKERLSVIIFIIIVVCVLGGIVYGAILLAEDDPNGTTDLRTYTFPDGTVGHCIVYHGNFNDHYTCDFKR